MSEETTVQIERCLARLTTGDTAARAELLGLAESRLRELTSRLLNGFPRVRQQFDDTAGVMNEAYLKLHFSVVEVKPLTAREFLGLASLEVRRVLLDQIRKIIGRGKTTRPGTGQLGTGGEGDGGAAEPGVSEEENSRLGMVIDLLESVNALPGEQKEVVHLLYYQGLTQVEAAEVMGVSKDTVKRRWAEARVRLADKLKAFDVPA